MESKKYYLRNEFVWNGLTEDQIISLQEKGTVEYNGKNIGFAPRITMFKNDDGFVEMFEITNDSVFLNAVLEGVTVSSGEMGRTIGIPTFTVPVNVVYAVRAVVSQMNAYSNNRFFPNIEDAIDYYNKIRGFIIQKHKDKKTDETPVEQ